jgi:hypothetical protein
VVSGAQLTAAGDAVLAGVRGLLATETVELGAAAQVAPEPAIQAPFNPIQPPIQLTCAGCWPTTKSFPTALDWATLSSNRVL